MNEIENKIDDLLERWEMQRSGGQELTPQQLCVDEPELVQLVAEKIEVLKAMSWAGEPDALVDLAVNDYTMPNDNAELPDSDLSADEFLKELSDSGILSSGDAVQVKQQWVSESDGQAKELANRLIESKLITSYQARVVLERGDSPLLLDRYIILDSLGAGGMGIVFKALHRTLERIVAVKVLPKHAVDSPAKVERFQREMRAAAKVSHPNVVQAFDAHESNGVYFFAMEYVSGKDLFTLVSRDGPVSSSAAIEIMMQATNGLAAAHESQLVHRDVKPGNILLSDDGTVKVLDLGLARSRELVQSSSQNDLTKEGLVMGTVAYMSPEQAFDAHSADVRSDIYSLGGTLYFLLHGTSMFARPTSVQTLIAHRELAAPQLGENRDDVSETLEALFQEMVAKSPDERPQSMQEVRRRLSVCLQPVDERDARGGDSQPIVASKKIAISTRHETPSKHGQSPLWKWAVAAVSLLILTAGLVAFLPKANDGFIPVQKFDADGIRQFVQQTMADDETILEFETLDGQIFDAEPGVMPEFPIKVVGALIFGDSSGECEQLARLPDLRQLSVTGWDNTDEVGTPDLNGINQMRSLQDLHLSGCVVTPSIVNAILTLPNLTSLHLDSCEFPKNVSSLKELSNLTELSLYEADLGDEDLTWLGDLKQLSYLDLSNTRVTTSTLRKLVGLPKLSELILTGTELNDDAQLFAELANLTMLVVDGTDFTDEHVSAITALKKLSTLDVSHTLLTGKGVSQILTVKTLDDVALQRLPVQHAVPAIAQLSGLMYLDLSDTDLTDNGLSKLSRLRNLALISVGGTNVTDAAIDRFSLRLPNCEVVEYLDEYMAE